MSRSQLERFSTAAARLAHDGRWSSHHGGCGGKHRAESAHRSRSRSRWPRRPRRRRRGRAQRTAAPAASPAGRRASPAPAMHDSPTLIVACRSRCWNRLDSVSTLAERRSHTKCARRADKPCTWQQRQCRRASTVSNVSACDVRTSCQDGSKGRVHGQVHWRVGSDAAASYGTTTTMETDHTGGGSRGCVARLALAVGGLQRGGRLLELLVGLLLARAAAVQQPRQPLPHRHQRLRGAGTFGVNMCAVRLVSASAACTRVTSIPLVNIETLMVCCLTGTNRGQNIRLCKASSWGEHVPEHSVSTIDWYLHWPVSKFDPDTRRA